MISCLNKAKLLLIVIKVNSTGVMEKLTVLFSQISGLILLLTKYKFMWAMFFFTFWSNFNLSIYIRTSEVTTKYTNGKKMWRI